MSASNRPDLDHLTTINRDGSRFFLHPADVKGKFTSARRVVAWILIAVFAALPWIKINGYPAVFIDVIHRRFHLFGFTIAPQDLWILFFLISGLAFGLFFITAVFGRIWCGWSCPQTVYLEHVYRRIERLLEGDAFEQRKLNQLPWSNPKKWMRRGSKLIIFWIVSWAISHIFLAYFISVPQLYQWVTQSPTENWHGFAFVGSATAILFFNFTWFREQLCIVICPYGRLQSALTDDDSLIIGYDETRGEPRGKASDPTAGDCIACNRCVQVCPTGIDIRHGLQMECIGCANCIDACDEIMDKVERPRGLIRYSSSQGLSGGKSKIIRPRIILYSVLMLLGMSAATYSLTKISSSHLSATRMRGAPFTLSDTHIRNQFQLRIINKSNSNAFYQLSLDSEIPGLLASGAEEPFQIQALDEILKTLVFQCPIEEYTGGFPIQITLTDTTKKSKINTSVNFLGPDPRLLKDQ